MNHLHSLLLGALQKIIIEINPSHGVCDIAFLLHGYLFVI